MSAIEEWYSLRKGNRGDNLDQSEERTESINGVNRTTTLFPKFAFLSWEQKLKIHNHEEEHNVKFT